MALYFDRIIDTPAGDVIVHALWHKVSGILAVCSASPNDGRGSVNLFTSECMKKNSSVLVQRSYQPTLCAWHPARNLLAIGWENGELVIWNEHTQELHEISTVHNSAITSLQWSNNGVRIASGDKNGVVSIWRVGEQGKVQLNPVCRLELGKEITQCVVPTCGSNDDALSRIASLARAAVSGDESALDQLSSSEGSSGASKLRLSGNANHGLSFYVGSSNGEVHYIDSKGSSFQCLKLGSAIRRLLFYKDKDALVSISSDLQVTVSRVHGDGKTEELLSVKLSGQGKADVTWAGDGLLAAATSDRSLRLWDLGSGDNYTLSLKTERGFETEECITCVSYSNEKRILAAGTNHSKLAMWSFVPSKLNSEEQWQLLQATKIETEAVHLEWCPRKPVVMVNGDHSVYLLTEQKMNWALSNALLAVQTTPKHALLEIIGKKTAPPSGVGASSLLASITDSSALSSKNILQHIDSEFFFTGIAVANQAIAIWNGSQVVIYDIVNGSLVPSGTFVVESSLNALHDQSFFSVEARDPKKGAVITVRNFQGTVKQLLQFQDIEGDISILHVNGNSMVATTTSGYIRVFDLSRRDVKPLCNAKNIGEMIPYFGSIQSSKCNCNGSKVALLIRKDNQVPDSKLFVWEMETDRLDNFDFDSDERKGSEAKQFDQSLNDIDETHAQSNMDVSGRYPLTLHWDTEEPRLLACEAQITDPARKSFIESHKNESFFSETREYLVEVLVVSLFSTPEEGILVQDTFEKTAEKGSFVGLKVPNFYFAKTVISAESAEEASKKPSANSSITNNTVCRTTMRDFTGLENCDESTRCALMDFSFYLTIGNMDEAFKSIKLIKSEAVWESMAKMCIKTRRVDVAKVCLGRMGHVRGAHALKLAEKEPEMDARVAMLAVQLGMNDEAEKLYKRCQRYDLLNKFYQAVGRWASALEVAEQNDRIHLRTTVHNYAKHLEQSGDVTSAIPLYEKAGTHHFEVPRILFEDIDMLETYIEKSKDQTFHRWWAQYMESTGDMETALKYYQQANDILSLVRVYCYCGQLIKASSLANDTGNRAACYHLARHYENIDDIKQAIHFYTRAATYGNAIRICKEHGFEDQLMNLSLLSTPNDMIEAASYYEDRPDTVDKAVMLYHKAGHFSKALKLAFDTQQFTALEHIAQDLDERADPVLLERCANFFLEHDQYDKAVSLLVIAKKYSEAVDLCLENNVKLDESLVERLSVPKDTEGYSAAAREQLLTKIANCCMKQGAYHLACKKYTQAGDKEQAFQIRYSASYRRVEFLMWTVFHIKTIVGLKNVFSPPAMRALLKSGDTEKIIFFAGVSRSRTIYVMAANYLQSLDWRKDPEIMKHIINFYTKGRALDSLAGFYHACAQVEIDEYQNYDKAMGALSEAYKCLSKAKMTNKQHQEDKLTELKTRISLVKKFIQAKRLFDTDTSEAAKQCQVLLAEPDLDSAVRVGDVYGLLVENYAQSEQNDKAYQMMQEMQSRIPTVNMAYYINMRTIEGVHSALGIPLGRGTNVGEKIGLSNDSEEDDMDDDVTEEIYNNGDSTIDTFRFR